MRIATSGLAAAAAAIAITGCLSIGFIAPAATQADERIRAYAAPAAHSSWTALPTPTHLTSPSEDRALAIAPPSICIGANACTPIRGSGVLGQTVIITCTATRNPLLRERGPAEVTTVYKGMFGVGVWTWSLLTQTPDAGDPTDTSIKRGAEHNDVESKDAPIISA
ncbi:hypothetical protein [Clavibacter zhangzhiyongii]|uniref:Lipoprotein n=1 Tax=Clavibacter zhangzhiyongii TaxID=2768071 RepID=A0A7L7YYV6_9MICO|nr:hypothetical protein [Clavibacter zhangzhiyongii]QOD42645.1 hypothetical protein H9X71_08285 [Clavibacter zhangzhiyongii]